MLKVICPVKNVEINAPGDCGDCVHLKGGMCVHPRGTTACTGISCIWCHLAKEGVKKAYSSIRKRRADRAK